MYNDLVNWKQSKPTFKQFKKKVFEQQIKVCDFIYQIGETEDLRKPSQEIPIDKIKSPEYIKKFKYLKSCLRKYKKLTGMGRGIAGVQVGIPEKVFAYFDENKNIKIVINPKITKVSREKLKYPEMCMSAAPIIAPVIRPAWVECEYLEEDGQKQKWYKKDKMLNRVFQHELDHLEGIINIDKCLSKDLILHSNPEFYNLTKFESVN